MFGDLNFSRWYFTAQVLLFKSILILFKSILIFNTRSKNLPVRLATRPSSFELIFTKTQSFLRILSQDASFLSNTHQDNQHKAGESYFFVKGFKTQFKIGCGCCGHSVIIFDDSFGNNDLQISNTKPIIFN